MKYQVITKDGRAKRARMETVHGTVETPVFMNVGTVGAIKGAVSTDDLREIGTQVELSKSDCMELGVKAPVRESGDVAGSGAITIEGPCGTLELKEGVIIAHNHIHVTEADSVKMNLKDKERVAVEVFSDRPVIFNDVIIRVSKNFSCRMHIDFDEANAASVSGFTLGRIIRKIETEGVGRSK